MRAEEIVDLWRAWDASPGNRARAVALEDACWAYAGDRAHEFRIHVNARRHAGHTLPAAIYSWDPR